MSDNNDLQNLHEVQPQNTETSRIEELGQRVIPPPLQRQAIADQSAIKGQLVPPPPPQQQ